MPTTICDLHEATRYVPPMVNQIGKPYPQKIAVIGGGNVDMDVCRSALRLGAKDTYILYYRTQAEMPADPDEVAEAMEECVQFRFLNAPAEILGENGKVTGIRVEIMELGEPDEKGRRKPVGTGKFETLAVDSVIGAIGQQIDWGCLDTGALATGKRAPPLQTRSPTKPRNQIFLSAVTATLARNSPLTQLQLARRAQSRCTVLCTRDKR